MALNAAALVWVTTFLVRFPKDNVSMTFVFFSTVSGYNFVKYFGLAKFHNRSLVAWLKAVQVLSFFAFLAMCYFTFLLNVKALVIAAICSGITFFYAMPLLPKRIFIDDKQNLRQISGLKIYIIGLVWTLATVVLPLINNEISINTDIVIIALQRFCFVLALMLPFEIRDLSYDSLKLATIPQRIGIKATKILGLGLLIVMFLLEFFKDELSNTALISTFIITAITALFIVFATQKQSKYYCAFWVEGLPTFWLALLLFFG